VSVFSTIWQTILDAFHWAIEVLHQGLEPVFGDHAWGWAIVALTVLVRVALLPLAIKQTRSMKAMQELQPKVKKLQSKYKVDRELLKKDPETYRAKKQKLNEEMMALYKEEGVNPAGGCLPLLAQAPVFFALFSVLRDTEFTALQQAPFYFFTSFASADASVDGLGMQVNQAGWPGWLLIVLMAATMFWSQRQMMARNAGAEGAQAQQQKMMMYIMPVFLAVVSLNFPMGVLLYWVTTNFWQMGQQAVIMREVEHHPNPPGGSAGNGARPPAGGKGPKGGAKAPKADTDNSTSKRSTPTKSSPTAPGGHLPRRKGSDD
jgi:YidC/Oxa1 family membrane protein insertase